MVYRISNTIMATLRQKKLARALVENVQADKPLNKMELVASVGYSDLSAEKKATEIIESVGTQKELRNLGFNAENAKRVVGEILDDETIEPKDRLKASELVFKVTGDFAAEKSINVNVNAEEMATIIKDGIAKFKAQ